MQHATTLPNHSPQAIAAENARFMSKVYRWMSAGILLSGVLAYYIGNTPQLVMGLLSNKILFYGLIIAEIGCVIYLSVAIKKMRASSATFWFLLYSALTGITLSVIFVAFQIGAIQSAFFTTTFAFAGLSAFGYFTQKDLGPIGSFCTMGLFGLIGFAILSMFFPAMMGPTSSKIYSIAGIVIFSGLTAYDTQKIKKMNIIGNEGTDEDHKEAIMGALKLYLDFLNLFMFILRLTGGNRR